MSGLPELIGNSPAVLAVRDEVCRLLQRQIGGRPLPPILIQGETGTGKGLLASRCHPPGRSPSRRPLRRGQLRRDSRNATGGGAVRLRAGRFHGRPQVKAGWCSPRTEAFPFSMRIGFLLGPLQGKLLTVREERTVRRLGRSEPVGIAVLAATNEDLERAVRASGGSRRRCTTGFPW